MFNSDEMITKFINTKDTGDRINRTIEYLDSKKRSSARGQKTDTLKIDNSWSSAIKSKNRKGK